jgi:Tfp pilus assembly protein PilV
MADHNPSPFATRSKQRSAFTLLEVLLALALTTITVFLIGAAIQVNLAVVDKSRNQVEEAQLARALLQRIRDDLANAVPYQPPLGSSSGSSSTSSSGGTSTAATQAAQATVVGSSGTDSTASSGTSGTDSSGSSSSSNGSNSMPVSGGLFGDMQSIRIETARRPRLTQAMLAASEDGSQPAMLSDLRIVSYSLGSPADGGTVATLPDGAAAGMYRTEIDRSLYYAAVQQGQSNPGDTLRLGDPTVGEIEDLKFTYYDGSTPNDTWDSVQQGKLPSAVRVTLTLRSVKKSSAAATVGGSLGFGGANGNQRLAVYEILVDLPNAAVTTSEIQALNQVDTSGMSGSGGGMGGGAGAGSGGTGGGGGGTGGGQGGG